jgi:hypothetical protein
MPVVYDSSGSNVTYPLNSAAGTITWTHNVNPNAANLQAFVAILWTGNVNASGATFSATFGGHAMTQIGQVNWASNGCYLTLFQYANPSAGANTVSISYASMPTSLSLQNFFGASVTYANVQTVGTPVLQTAPGTGTVNNAVTVASLFPCDRVISFHGTGTGVGNYFTGYTGLVRANPSLFNGGQLAVQDSAGATGNVTLTATDANSTNWWGAIGLNLVPTPIAATVRGVPMGMAPPSGRGGIHRVSTPPNTRTWRVAADVLFPAKTGAWWPTTGLTPHLSASFTQGPNSVLDYGVLLDVWMAPGDSLASVSFTEPTGAITVISQGPNTDGVTAVAWLEGGTSPGTYIVNCHVTTVAGRQDDFQFSLIILAGQ